MENHSGFLPVEGVSLFRIIHFRVDMAGSLVKNDPEGRIKYFWQDIRSMLDTEYPQAFMVSEWSDPKEALNGGFHADFLHWVGEYNDLFQKEKARNPFANGNSFFDKEGKGDISRFLNMYVEQYAATKGKGYISLPIGNHDLIRINNNGRDQRDLDIIQVFNFTMPNIPFIYYGDEIGMRQLSGFPAKEGAYLQRAGARTPLQWSRGINDGFSKASPDKLYFPVDTTDNAPNVDDQQDNPLSLLNFTRKLAVLHKEQPALTNYAWFVPVYVRKDAYPFIFERILGKDKF